MNYKALVGAIFLTCGAHQSAQAGDALHYRIHHEYESPRAQGMGNAFVAVADDYSAVFYNPAGLVRRKNTQFNGYLDFRVSDSFSKLAGDLSEASSTGTSSEQQEAINEVINNNYGKQFYTRTSLFGGVLARPGWGMAIIPLDVTIDLAPHKQLTPAISTRVYSDTIIAFSGAEDKPWIKDGHLSVGYTFKLINRGYFAKSITPLDLVADPSFVKATDFKEGVTLDVDLGALYTPELPNEGFLSLLKLAKPTFGLVVRNVLDYGYLTDANLYNKETTEQPEKLYRRIDIGSRWEYPELWIFGGRGVLDIRDMLHPDFTFKKGLHLGFEFDWTVTSWWKGQYRVGLNQGYMTMGLSALFAVFNLDLLTYGEDVGTLNAPQENRVYAMRLNLDF